MEEQFFEEKVVHGFFQNEELIQEGYSRQDYSNLQIQDHLDLYFRLFGKSDLDIIYLYFLSNKKQHEIKSILDKTQPAVSYDVNRIKNQMQFVIKMIQKQDDFVLFIINENNGLTLKERELLLVFFYSTSLVKTSKILGQNQITCRTRIRKAIEKLKEIGETDMYLFFCYILENLNVIKKKCF